MKPTNRHRPFQVVTSLLLSLIASGLMLHPARAQFGSPPGQGIPSGTAGGGSRPPSSALCLDKNGSQPQAANLLIAMAPPQTLGYTAQAHPTVWVYIPGTTAKTLELSLFTEDQEGVMQTNLPLTSTGLVKVSFPTTTALTPGKLYHWTVALVCNPERRTDDWVVGGWIQKNPLTADLQQQLAHATPEQQVTLYAKAGFWYEALNTYLNLHQAHPENSQLKSLWSDLLKTGGLSAIAPTEMLLRIADPSFATQAHR